MISPWRIFSSVLLAAALQQNAMTALAASVTGRVELRDSKDPSVRKKADYSGVVVWLEATDAKGPGPAVPRPARMVQKDKTFRPHVLAVAAGTSVEFPNFDPIFHNAFSNYSGQIFDVGLYPPGSTRSVRFTRPGIVRVFCNIHATMSAVIVVLDTPYFAQTSGTGDFAISGVPAGNYILHVFHERATQATLDAIAPRLKVATSDVAAPPVSISEGGYLAIPHKNKFGKDYPPVPDEGGLYPGARK